MIKLGVNVDHVATLRQARLIKEPDPVEAAVLAEQAGADCITVHLREDRRHINERDVRLLKEIVKTKLNLEMSVSEEIVKIACFYSPDMATIVPEKREELTTEGGLNVTENYFELKKAVEELKSNNITVSFFIDPDFSQIEATKELGVGVIELHTGKYCETSGTKEKENELEHLFEAADFARNKLGMTVNAGHGLNYKNTSDLVKKIPFLNELNIGHSVVGKSVFVGIFQAVKEMKYIIGYKQ